MANFPPVGSVVCGCDEDSACTFHAEMIYQRGFQGVLDAMMKQAADLYKSSPLDSEINRLAKVDSREVYCDAGPDGDNCLACPTCRM